MTGLIRHAPIVSLQTFHQHAGYSSNYLEFAVTSWKNTELRSYTLADCGEDGMCMEETPESRQRRGLSPLGPTLADQLRLRDESIQSWIKWGVIS